MSDINSDLFEMEKAFCQNLEVSKDLICSGMRAISIKTCLNSFFYSC